MSKHYVDLNQIIDHLEDEWGYEGMREELYEIPPADVVEVVRCKDCEYWDSKEKVCNHCWGGIENCRENEFCSRGERKETE